MKRSRLLIRYFIFSCLLIISFFISYQSLATNAEEVNKPFRFTFDNCGKTVTGYMVIPSPAPNPTVLFIQGSGVQAEETFKVLEFYAARGFTAASVNYDNETYEDLVAAVRFLKQNRYVKKDCLNLVGFSRGARYGLFVAGVEPVHAVVAIAGRYIVDEKNLPKPELSPLSNISGITCPVLLLHSQGDPHTPVENSIEMEKALKSIGKTVRLKLYDAKTHWPGGEQPLRDSLEFLK